MSQPMSVRERAQFFEAAAEHGAAGPVPTGAAGAPLWEGGSQARSVKERAHAYDAPAAEYSLEAEAPESTACAADEPVLVEHVNATEAECVSPPAPRPVSPAAAAPPTCPAPPAPAETADGDTTVSPSPPTLDEPAVKLLTFCLAWMLVQEAPPPIRRFVQFTGVLLAGEAILTFCPCAQQHRRDRDPGARESVR
eukprot:TRINITY_DN14276_c0_g1_i1.p1 TRINITY_DN14276_c0_g1~~TRINITY_DN14276_c0_g1_i1.p1  ORF type:complete len:195 (+),score=25.60 TRINITY_DN14276_c0_g1_i1:1105-1689(+)